MKWVLLILGVALLAAHQDSWDFNRVEPLVFGFLPVSLAYHAGYSLACAGFMFLLVRFAWPAHLEPYESQPVEPPREGTR